MEFLKRFKQKAIALWNALRSEDRDWKELLPVLALLGGALLLVALIVFLLKEWGLLIFTLAIFICLWLWDSGYSLPISNSNPCADCAGCSVFYPVIRQTVFQAVCQCSNLIGVRRPATERMMETATSEQLSSNVPRYSFRLMKRSMSDEATPIDILTECMAQSISDSFAANANLFAGSGIYGLYLDTVTQNDFSYMLHIVPICSRTQSYVTQRDLATKQAYQKQQMLGECYDENF